MYNRNRIDLNDLDLSTQELIQSIDPAAHTLEVSVKWAERNERFTNFMQATFPETVRSLQLVDVSDSLRLDLIGHHPQITELTLELYYTVTRLAEASFSSIAEMLKALERTSLTKLTLSNFFNCNFNADEYDGQKIVPSNIVKLNLSANFIGCTMLMSDWLDLFIHDQLTHLNLSMNNLYHNCREEILQVNFPSRLEFLDLSGNDLGMMTLKQVSTLLEIIPQQTTVRLSGNGFDTWENAQREELMNIIFLSGRNIEIESSIANEINNRRNMSFLRGCIEEQSQSFGFFNNSHLSELSLAKNIFELLPSVKPPDKDIRPF